MDLILVSIKDRKVQAFHAPSTVRAIGEATRNFQDAVNDPKNGQLYNHPEDFELYRLGTYDDQTGQIAPETPKLIAGGDELQTNKG